MARTAPASGPYYQRLSGPWPWVDLPVSNKVDHQRLIPESSVVPLCDHNCCGGECWTNYPESRFPDWMITHVRGSNVINAVEDGRDRPSTLYYIDVDDRGQFNNTTEIVVTKNNIDWSWGFFVADRRPLNLSMRVLFIEHLTKPVLKMLGAKFDIDPRFWTSSLNRVPSCNQDHPQPKQSSRITICLVFLRSVKSSLAPYSGSSPYMLTPAGRYSTLGPDIVSLSSRRQLLLFDVLSVHLIRKTKGSTIISYHPTFPVPVTTAQDLQQQIQLDGQSASWQNIFQRSSDPIFMMLPFLWHVLSAWREALANLSTYINLVEEDIYYNKNSGTIQELYQIRTHHLQYSSLLADLRATVQFIQKFPSSALLGMDRGGEDLAESVLDGECDILLREVQALEDGLSRLEAQERLSGLIDLILRRIRIDMSQRTQKRAEVATNSIIIKTYSAYLVMLILPALLIANVFKMNINEVTPGASAGVSQFIGAALGVTLGTCWIVIALQCHSHPISDTLFARLCWPILWPARRMGILKSTK